MSIAMVEPYSTENASRKTGWLAFLAAWIRAPRQMGAIWPSSRGLSDAMAAQVPLDGGIVVELGAGTGVVTEALLKRGIAPDKLIAIEPQEKLHRMLHEHFPGIMALRRDARELRDILAERQLGQVSAVVSGLPLLSLKPETREEVVEEIAEAIGQDGVLVQFTYSMLPSIRRKLRKRHHLRGHCVAHVWRNLPPAHVWVYRKSLVVSR